MLIFYIQFQLSYDEWLPEVGAVYKLETTTRSPAGDRRTFSLAPPLAAASALRRDFDQFDAVTAFYTVSARLRLDGAATSQTIVTADDRFFDVFAFEFLVGSRETALDDPSGIVLSATEAKRLFGRIDAVGDTLTQIRYGDDRVYRVTGVFEDIKANSHLDIPMVRPIDPSVYQETPDPLSDWGSLYGYVYAKLAAGADIAAVNESMAAFEARHLPAGEDGAYNYAAQVDFRFVPAADVHLHHSHDGAMKPGGDIGVVRTLSVIMGLILAMACINFVNLSTAQAVRRSKDIAVRKVFGATAPAIVLRHLGEVALVTGAAAALALAAAAMAMPAFANALGLPLSAGAGDPLDLAAAVGALLIITVLGAGLYPALSVLRFRPVSVLKANRSTETRGSSLLRKVLVVGQFAVSIGLIICTGIIYFQTDHARSLDPGYARQALIVMENVDRGPVAQGLPAFEQRAARSSAVRAAAAASLLPASANQANTAIRRPGGESREIGWIAAAPGFFSTLQIPLRAGRAFDAARPMDDASVGEGRLESQQALLARGANVILSETAVRYLGFADPAAAVGRRVDVGLVRPELGLVRATVIGVAADARFRSVRDPVRPLLYFQDRDAYRYLFVRHAEGAGAAAVQDLRQAWIQAFPDMPFQARRVGQDLAALYEEEAAQSRVLAAFSGLAVLIACFGLYGLAAFSAEARTKEVGIRKVMGADRFAVAKLLTWQFLSPVLLANVIAWPVAWWLMRQWLAGFESRIALDPLWFLAAGAAAALIATATVSGHALKVASEKPVRALRYE